MQNLLATLLQLYVFVIFGRIILSWFPLDPGSALAEIYSVLYRLTEPVLGPVRRMLPASGPFDLSPIIVVLALEIIGGAIIRSL